ncbi:MAG: DMT family transporter [Anaerovoracaceae bacterium]
MKKEIKMAYVALVLSVLFWGLVFIASKDLLNYMGPNTLSLLRCVVALICLLPFAIKKGFTFGTLKNKRYVAYGLIGCAAHYMLLNNSVDMCSAGMSSLLQAMIPIYGLVLGYFVLGEPLLGGKILGGVLSISGIGIASWEAISTGGDTRLAGVTMMVVAVLFWSVYTALSKKWDKETESIIITVALFFYGVIFMTPFVGYELFSGCNLIINWRMLLELAFVGIFATAGTVTLWNFAIKNIDSGVASVALNVVPVIGIGAAALLGESVTMIQYIGCAVVMLGVAISNSRFSQKSLT